MTVECGNYTIIFELENSIYTAFTESSVGKTRAAKLLKGAVAAGRDDILVLDYERVAELERDKIISMITERKYSLIFTDRADRWCNPDMYDVLYDIGAIVYADFKANNPEDMSGHYCEIEFTGDCIRFYK